MAISTTKTTKDFQTGARPANKKPWKTIIRTNKNPATPLQNINPGTIQPSATPAPEQKTPNGNLNIQKPMKHPSPMPTPSQEKLKPPIEQRSPMQQIQPPL